MKQRQQQISDYLCEQNRVLREQLGVRRTAVRNLPRAGVAESGIMKITGHRTRGIFERYKITEQSDTVEDGKVVEELLK